MSTQSTADLPRWATRHPEAWAAARTLARTAPGAWGETVQARTRYHDAHRSGCPVDPVESVRRALGAEALHPDRR